MTARAAVEAAIMIGRALEPCDMVQWLLLAYVLRFEDGEDLRQEK